MLEFTSGLVSFLTPGVFLFSILFGVLFPKLGRTSRINWIQFSVFLGLAFLFINSFFFLFGPQTLSNPYGLIFFIKIGGILLTLWFLNASNLIKHQRIKGIVDSIFRAIGAPICGLVLFVISMASMGPILASIILSSMNQMDGSNVVYSVFLFSIGAILPVGLTFAGGILINKKFRDHPNWKATQTVMAVLLLLVCFRVFAYSTL